MIQGERQLKSPPAAITATCRWRRRELCRVTAVCFPSVRHKQQAADLLARSLSPADWFAADQLRLICNVSDCRYAKINPLLSVKQWPVAVGQFVQKWQRLTRDGVMYRRRQQPSAALPLNHRQNGRVVDLYVGVRDGRVNVLRATAPAAADRVKSRQCRVGSLRAYRSIRRHHRRLPTNGGARSFPRQRRVADDCRQTANFRRFDDVVCRGRLFLLLKTPTKT